MSRQLDRLHLWLRSLLRRRRAEEELDEELRFHVEQQTEQNIARGIPASEARYAALREFGGVAQAQEECRDAWGVRFLNELAQDVHYGLRTMRHNAGITAVIVATLALGIGANTAIFSLIDAVLLKSLPVPSPDELFTVTIRSASGPGRSFSYPLFEDLRDAAADVAEVIATGGLDSWEVLFPSPGGVAEPERVFGELVSVTYFSCLGVNAVVGRALAERDATAADDQPVAAISYAFWVRRFGGNPDVLGRRFILNDTTFTIVGVMPAEFFGVRLGSATDVWIPLTTQPLVSRGRSMMDSYRNNWLRVMGRPRKDVTREHIAAAMNVRFRQVLETRAADQQEQFRERFLKQSIELEDGRGGVDYLRRRYSEPLRILMVVVGLVLLIACANVANLLLARATARQREVAIRLAIGAGRRRLIRQWLTESLLLAAGGGLAGVGLAFLGVRALVAMVSTSVSPVVLEVEPDLRLIGFTAAITTAAAVLFGLAPALRGTRADLRGTLGAMAPGLISGRRGEMTRRALAVFQIALSLVLVIGAGLFLRTVYNLKTVDSGYQRENLITGFIAAHDAGYALPFGGKWSDEEKQAAESRIRALHARLLASLEAVPEVQSASLTMCGFTFGCEITNCCFEVDGRARNPDDRGNIRVESVSPGYIETTGMTLLAGRNFTALDGPGSARVAIVNETLARNYFGGPNAVGQYFHWDDDSERIAIVGVSKDVNHNGPRRDMEPFIYYPLAQRPNQFVSVVVRTRAAPARVAPQIRDAVKQADSRLTINVAPVEQYIDSEIARELLLAQLTTLFGLLALAVTCVGLYGLMSYSVARRTSEIGLRMALGAERTTILWGVLSETLLVAAIGLIAGVLGALATTHLAGSLLFEVAPGDPLTILVAAGVLAAVAACAAFFPANRAAKIHPMKALRYE